MVALLRTDELSEPVMEPALLSWENGSFIEVRSANEKTKKNLSTNNIGRRSGRSGRTQSVCTKQQRIGISLKASSGGDA